MQILLAEDNAINRKMTLRILARMGYLADVALNGLEVMSALKKQSYDLILMDVQMPEMDGIQATQWIRRESEIPRQPRIVALTANARIEDRDACLEAGMDDFLSKPIKVEHLVAVLKNARKKAPN